MLKKSLAKNIGFTLFYFFCLTAAKYPWQEEVSGDFAVDKKKYLEQIVELSAAVVHQHYLGNANSWQQIKASRCIYDVAEQYAAKNIQDLTSISPQELRANLGKSFEYHLAFQLRLGSPLGKIAEINFEIIALSLQPDSRGELRGQHPLFGVLTKRQIELASSPAFKSYFGHLPQLDYQLLDQKVSQKCGYSQQQKSLSSPGLFVSDKKRLKEQVIDLSAALAHHHYLKEAISWETIRTSACTYRVARAVAKEKLAQRAINLSAEEITNILNKRSYYDGAFARYNGAVETGAYFDELEEVTEYLKFIHLLPSLDYKNQLDERIYEKCVFNSFRGKLDRKIGEVFGNFIPLFAG